MNLALFVLLSVALFDSFFKILIFLAKPRPVDFKAARN